MNTIDICAGLGITFLVYFIQLGVYWYVNRFPPAEINSLYGYRTKRSMKNKENWIYANALNKRLMIRAAHIFLIAAVLLLLIFSSFLSLQWYTGISTGLYVAMMLGTIVITEYKLKQFEKTQP